MVLKWRGVSECIEREPIVWILRWTNRRDTYSCVLSSPTRAFRRVSIWYPCRQSTSVCERATSVSAPPYPYHRVRVHAYKWTMKLVVVVVWLGSCLLQDSLKMHQASLSLDTFFTFVNCIDFNYWPNFLREIDKVNYNIIFHLFLYVIILRRDLLIVRILVRNRRLRGWKSNFVVCTSYRFAHRQKNRSNAGTSCTRGRVPMANWREKISFLHLLLQLWLRLIFS